MNITISSAKLLDIMNIKLREVDVLEARLRNGTDAKLSMVKCFLHDDEINAVHANEEVIAIFGVHENTIWMMGSDRLADPDVRFAHRIVKKEMKKLVQKYGVLENFVWANNLVHVDWIKFAGFRFTGHDFEINGQTFLHFERCK